MPNLHAYDLILASRSSEPALYRTLVYLENATRGETARIAEAYGRLRAQSWLHDRHTELMAANRALSDLADAHPRASWWVSELTSVIWSMAR